MEELNKAFNEYMQEFKKLDTKDKRREVVTSIKELIVAFDKLAQTDNIELHYLRSPEVQDLKKENVSEDDFLEAELVYIEVAKNMIGEYLEYKV